MMSQLKKQLESFLTTAAQEGIAKLDKNSPIVRELRNLDVNQILHIDIHQICQEISFPELVKVMSLVAKVKSERHGTERHKENIKKIAKAIEKRIEQKLGTLQTPPLCRELLFDL